MRSIALGLAVLFTATTLAVSAKASETLEIPSRPIPTVPAARPAPGPLRAILTRPAAAGPVPAIILLHGCGGLGRGMDAWVARVNAWGYAAVVPLSFPARDVKSVCAPADQPKVTGPDRAGDVLNTAMVLRATPGIDGRRIGVIGFSHGGGTAAVVTQSAFDAFQPGLIKAAVDYYGPCRFLPLHGNTPLLALNGSDDSWGRPAATCQQFARQLMPEQHFENHTYPDVVHAFDNPRLVRRVYNQGHPLQYDSVAAEDSYARAKAFMDRWVRGPN